MRSLVRARLLAGLLACAAALTFPGAALPARPGLAIFPPESLGVFPAAADNASSAAMAAIATSFRDVLQDRFDITLVTGEGYADASRRVAKARAIGASYILTSTLSRIGRTLTLDGTISPVEEPEKGRTVVVTGAESPSGAGLPDASAYRRMAIQTGARLKVVFLGDDVVGEGEKRRKITGLSGVLTKSRNLPGDVLSIVRQDTDRDGKPEVVAAYTDAIVIYRMVGTDLEEKARIPGVGAGIVHVDAADINRNGIAEIIATRFEAGQALSDIYEFEGGTYRKKISNIPYFLRSADLGKEGVVLLAQASDPNTFFKGPIFRPSPDLYGRGEVGDGGRPLPLPDGTWIYAFSPVRYGNRTRYVAYNDRDRIVLYDEAGKMLWEGMDAVGGTETKLDAAEANPDVRAGKERAAGRLYIPARILPVDLDGDRVDEIVLMNNIMAAGVFFENVRFYSNAEALCFVQEGNALRLAWRSPLIGGAARDAFVEFVPETKTFRLGIAGQDRGKILEKSAEWRLNRLQ